VPDRWRLYRVVAW